MHAERVILPHRRASETFNVDFGGMRTAYVVTCGYYADGTLGEIFINGAKSGEQIESVARDGAVLLSIALQHGVPLTTLSGAITRDVNGAPQSIVGAVLDELLKGGYDRLK